MVSIPICCYCTRSYNLTIVRSIGEADAPTDSKTYNNGHPATISSAEVVPEEKLEEGGARSAVVGAVHSQVSIMGVNQPR